MKWFIILVAFFIAGSVQGQGQDVSCIGQPEYYENGNIKGIEEYNELGQLYQIKKYNLDGFEICNILVNEE